MERNEILEELRRTSEAVKEVRIEERIVVDIYDIKKFYEYSGPCFFDRDKKVFYKKGSNGWLRYGKSKEWSTEELKLYFEQMIIEQDRKIDELVSLFKESLESVKKYIDKKTKELKDGKVRKN